MGNLITIENKRSLASTFNARRVDSNLQFARELQHLEKHVSNNQELQRCSQESFAHVLLEAAAMGVTFNPALHHAYAIPYDGQATLHVGYRGMESQVLDAGTIKDIQTDLVCKNDPVFEEFMNEDGYKRIRHQKARANRGEVSHAYCIAHFVGGGMHVEVMERWELDACEKAASARNRKGGMVWRSKFKPEMQKKAVVRRSWKHWPKDSEGRMARVIEQMERQEPMNFDAIDDEDQAVCMSGDDVEELREFLRGYMLDDGLIDRWLARLAEVNGRASVEDLPASKKEQFLTQLKSYAIQHQARQEANRSNAQ